MRPRKNQIPAQTCTRTKEEGRERERERESAQQKNNTQSSVTTAQSVKPRWMHSHCMVQQVRKSGGGGEKRRG